MTSIIRCPVFSGIYRHCYRGHGPAGIDIAASGTGAGQLTAAPPDLILRPPSSREWRGATFGDTTQDHGALHLGRPRRDQTRGRSAASIMAIATLIAIVVGGCAGIGSASGTFRPAHHGVLTVVTQPLPTVGFWNGTDTRPTGGLEYGIARDLAHHFGLRLVVKTEPFSRIVAGQLDGADLALSLITPTSTRDQVLDFSSPYIDRCWYAPGSRSRIYRPPRACVGQWSQTRRWSRRSPT
jgi:hypothetical protein